MKDYVARMIEEHRELNNRIKKLDEYVYGPGIKQDSTDEVINKAIQLRGMRMYYDALSARLFNEGIRFNDEEYAEIIAVNQEPVMSDRSNGSGKE